MSRWLCLAVLVAGLAACQAQPTAATRPPGGRVLIVYVSRTGNTRAVAEMIQRQTGGRLVPLQLQTPYPADYRAHVEQVARENESGFLPPLKTRIDSLEAYTTVFVGFPTWGMQLPPPMKSFLKTNALSGKTVVPFNTHGGYGTGSSFDTLKALCTGCRVLEGFSVSGGREREGQLLNIQGRAARQVEADVQAWLRKIGLVQR